MLWSAVGYQLWSICVMCILQTHRAIKIYSLMGVLGFVQGVAVTKVARAVVACLDIPASACLSQIIAHPAVYMSRHLSRWP